MKKLISFLLIGVLTLVFFTGCKGKDAGENVDLGQADLENQTESVGTSNETETKDDIEAVEDIDYILYLRYNDKPFLYDEYFTVNINDDKLKDKSIEEFVLQQLIDYEQVGDFITPVPEGTKLISVKREDTNVIVNLSKEFTEKKMSSSDAMLTIGGIVNTIIALPGNETVQIMVEGEILESFNGVETSEPLYFLEGLFPDK